MAKKQEKKALYSIIDPSAGEQYKVAYENLYSTLEYINVDSECKRIVVTSAEPNDRKSNIAVNLGYALANHGKSVCVLDCDLRKSCFYDFFKKEKGETLGVAHLLAGLSTLDEVIYNVPECETLSMIFSGDSPSNPVVLLKGENMKRLIDELSEKFEYVIFDTPPINLVPDAEFIARCSDGVLLAACQNKTDSRNLKRAKDILDAKRIKVFGVVLTNYSRKKGKGRYGYEYDYGYGNDRFQSGRMKK